MIRFAVSPRERRILRLGGLAMGAMWLLRAVPALLAWQQSIQTRAQYATLTLARASTGTGALREVSDSLRVRRARLAALLPHLVSGATPAQAAAALTSIVSSAAADAKVTLGAAEPWYDTTTSNALVPVRVRAMATGDVTGLARMISSLESGPTLVAIRELTITQSDIAAPDERPEALRIDLVVEGLTVAGRVSTHIDRALLTKAREGHRPLGGPAR
jgi:hypothetical protein